jgi:hypothetical protein
MSAEKRHPIFAHFVQYCRGLRLLFVSRLQKHAISDDNRGTVSASGNGRNPFDRFFAAEYYRRLVI